MKLKQMSIPVRVNISFPNGGCSFEGQVVEASESLLRIEAPMLAAFLRVARLQLFDFRGILQETDVGINFTVLIITKGKFDDPEVLHINLSASWQNESTRPRTVN